MKIIAKLLIGFINFAFVTIFVSLLAITTIAKDTALSCSSTEHSCGDGACVGAQRVCDGRVDCTDGSDEKNCQSSALALLITINRDIARFLNRSNVVSTNCRKNQWQCNDGTCIASGDKCNRVVDCADGSDEAVVVCRSSSSNDVIGDAEAQPPFFESNYYPEDEEDTPQGNTASECGKLEAAGLPKWHSAIYKKSANTYKLLCVGSLVRNNIIISAAQCFWRDKLPLVAAQYAAAVGQRGRPLWDDSLDGVQKSEAAKITIPNRYQADHANYQDDISVVVVAKPFHYNELVGPVCLDFEYSFDHEQLTGGNFGQITGWWKAEDGEAPTRLQVRRLPYVDIKTCLAKAGPLLNYLTSDKICAGYQNRTTFCRSDEGATGAGYAFPSAGSGRYYLRGVVSILPVSPTLCYVDFNSFTQLTKHEQFLRADLEEEPLLTATEHNLGNPNESNSEAGHKCLLPSALPAHGSYTTQASRLTNVTEEGSTYELVTLTVTCERGFGVQGPSSIKCFNGFWPDKIPKCVRMCPLKAHPSVEYRCLLSGAQEGFRACRAHEPPGAVVNPRCREPNYYSSSPLPFMHCQKDARWDYIVRCKPDCGRPTPKGTGLVHGGEDAERGELPWHAGIYDKDTRPYLQVCGGSIISNDLIVSAAHCFWKGKAALAASRFAVAVGKIYRPWNDPMDDAQKSDVKRIHLPPRFRGAEASFQDDIAVVEVTHAFEYKNYIRPVCLSFDSNFERRQLQTINKGKVAGWGLTSANGKAAPILQVVDLPYVEVDTCIANSPPSFTQYITSDKICAGTRQPNTALCQGDSGGGLAFPATDSYIERYYLRGVVSTSPNDEGNNRCNLAAYTSFTKILQHQDFIAPLLTD